MSEDSHHFFPEPILDEAARPRWTVLIPTFNCAGYLETALLSVLAQDRGPEEMQIVVVDDHSTRDDPESVVRRVAGSRVMFVRQERNVGKVRNYETGLALSRGMLIHQLHGDDRVRPRFYDVMEAAFGTHPEAGAFFCESWYVDTSGNVTGRTGSERAATGLVDDFLDRIVVSQRIQTPAMVVRRVVYETLGAFDRRLDSNEDWEMWIRIATRYPVGFVDEPLAEYRTSDSNATVRTLVDGSHVRTLRSMLEIVDRYLPRELVSRRRNDRERAMADYLTQLIPSLLSRGRRLEAMKLAVEALSFSASRRTLSRLLYFARGQEKLVG